jgi:hypothetical protein
MRLTWKREERKTGLARVTQGERGYALRMDGEQIGAVYPFRGRKRGAPGYYWTAWVNGKTENTRENPLPTIEDAKAACKAWVLAELTAGKGVQR